MKAKQFTYYDFKHFNHRGHKIVTFDVYSFTNTAPFYFGGRIFDAFVRSVINEPCQSQKSSEEGMLFLCTVFEGQKWESD